MKDKISSTIHEIFLTEKISMKFSLPKKITKIQFKKERDV
jgi:hypothetical protein